MSTDHRQPLLTLGRYLRQEFGFRVQKLSIDAGFTCPNRDGTCGYGGCIYCSNASFSPGRERGAGVRRQLQAEIARVQSGRRSRANHYLAYFQSFSNTYAPLDRLRALYDEALNVDGVVGLDISTRPDCVPGDVVDLLAGYAQHTHVWVEVGAQSSHDRTLETIQRGHDWATTVRAVKRLSGRGIRLCMHLILGLPDETRAMVRTTAQRVGQLLAEFDGPAVGIKLHHLHVVRDTALHRRYLEVPFDLLDVQEYVAWAADCLERLPADTVVHRFMGDALPGSLVAPLWNVAKPEVLRRIEQELADRGSGVGAWAPVRTERST